MVTGCRASAPRRRESLSTHEMPVMPPDSNRFNERRVLAWMCAIIFVNQLGFGAVIPVLPLHAR